ncbi:hypothetical protein KBT16_19370 [Nostoc sp. CCCryo 231-06]|nr:hypothetical protein [Nostoc sp. CCCryo 231-06]
MKPNKPRKKLGFVPQTPLATLLLMETLRERERQGRANKSVNRKEWLLNLRRLRFLAEGQVSNTK